MCVDVVVIEQCQCVVVDGRESMGERGKCITDKSAT